MSVCVCAISPCVSLALLLLCPMPPAKSCSCSCRCAFCWLVPFAAPSHPLRRQQFNLEQSGAIKCKNAKHIRSKCAHTHRGTHSGMHRHAQHNPVGRRLTVPIPVASLSLLPAAADATHVPWPCHLLNEMSSKLAVNLFAIFLLRCY